MQRTPKASLFHFQFVYRDLTQLHLYDRVQTCTLIQQVRQNKPFVQSNQCMKEETIQKIKKREIDIKLVQSWEEIITNDGEELKKVLELGHSPYSLSLFKIDELEKHLNSIQVKNTTNKNQGFIETFER